MAQELDKFNKNPFDNINSRQCVDPKRIVEYMAF